MSSPCLFSIFLFLLGTTVFPFKAKQTTVTNLDFPGFLQLWVAMEPKTYKDKLLRRDPRKLLLSLHTPFYPLSFPLACFLLLGRSIRIRKWSSRLTAVKQEASLGRKQAQWRITSPRAAVAPTSSLLFCETKQQCVYQPQQPLTGLFLEQTFWTVT